MAEDVGRVWVRSTLSDHRKRGFQIAITNNELYHFYQMAMANPCPYCGRMMKHGNGGPIESSPSLDAINPHNRVISVFNIQIICHLCNTTKNRRSHKEFINYCRGVIESHEDT